MCIKRLTYPCCNYVMETTIKPLGLNLFIVWPAAQHFCLQAGSLQAKILRLPLWSATTLSTCSTPSSCAVVLAPWPLRSPPTSYSASTSSSTSTLPSKSSGSTGVVTWRPAEAIWWTLCLTSSLSWSCQSPIYSHSSCASTDRTETSLVGWVHHWCRKYPLSLAWYKYKGSKRKHWRIWLWDINEDNTHSRQPEGHCTLEILSDDSFSRECEERLLSLWGGGAGGHQQVCGGHAHPHQCWPGVARLI